MAPPVTTSPTASRAALASPAADYRVRAPALFLAADAIDTGSPRLMGRQSAGSGFLRGLARAFRDQPTQTLQLLCPQAEDLALARTLLQSAGWTHPIAHLPSRQPAAWRDFDLLHYPAPFSDALGWQRARHGISRFAFSGITHTISSDAVMRQLAGYVTGPFAHWDALICTSHSVLRAVQGIWREQVDYLAWRMGGPLKPSLPMLPVIPLGIHCEDFVAPEGERDAGRRQWGVGDDEIVVLFVGRLSLHAKANPLAMYLACARAAAASGKTIRVLECGWFANDAIRASFDEAARVAGVRVDRVDGRLAGVTRRAYASADIFVSLSDNIQETFGLTPVEAMAAGLPVVVSDWDGYRETVREGLDGLLIPTHQPADPACADDLIENYADGRINYDHYVAHAHMLVAVDVEACAAAIARLALDPALRARMGASGRRRAREQFDWSVVMPRYQDLWTEQAARLDAHRQSGGATGPRGDPGMPNPLAMFAHYPTGRLDAMTRLCRVTCPGTVAQGEPADGAAQGFPGAAALRDLAMWRFSAGWLPDAAFVSQALAALPLAPAPGLPLGDWARALGASDTQSLRLAAWLLKTGLIRMG